MPLESIALTFVPNLGVRGAAYLLDCFGSARAVYAATAGELRGRGALREDIVRRILSHAGFAEAERELAYCAKYGIKAVAADSNDYPPLLREAEDFPAVLYVRGDVEALHRRSVAFVGTRKISSYGQRMCDKIVGELGQVASDAVVVSGLAFGVDGASHRAALANGMTTVAVLANTLPAVNPAAHRALAEDILSSHGAIVSELNSQTKQNGRFFISRNRIIAALAAGTVVVESPESGGSLSTAAFADGYNRAVMAVPGRVGDSNSLGCNLLIRNRKAQLVLSGYDVAAELMWDVPEERVVESMSAETVVLSPAEERLLAMFDSDPVGIDKLLECGGFSAGELSLHLMNLEFAGLLRQLPGKMYEKCR